MHAVEEKQRVVQDERANVRQKRSALEIIKRDEANTENTHGSDSLVDTRKRDQFLKAKLLKDEIDQLADDLTKEERLLHELNVKKKELEEKLYTIGIDNSDAVIDGFPDFTTHYENKRGSKKQRSRL